MPPVGLSAQEQTGGIDRRCYQAAERTGTLAFTLILEPLQSSPALDTI
jgi:hypothetical protein